MLKAIRIEKSRRHLHDFTLNTDLALDIHGNIALASKIYAQAQDVSSACRLFNGELWYDTTKGVPHFDEALGRVPSLALYKHSLEEAALTVPGVVEARAVFGMGAKGRILEGAIRFVNEDNKEGSINL